jgi:copper(I)-binding protein
MKVWPLSFSIFALLLAASIISVPTPPGVPSTDITAHHGAVYQTSKAGDPTEGFVQIVNTGVADRLIAVDCPLADTTSLVDANGKPVASLDIPAHGTVTLAAGAAHISLVSTHFAVAYGAVVPCSLSFAGAGTVSVFLYATAAP